jgi:hypothetical protein
MNDEDEWIDAIGAIAGLNKKHDLKKDRKNNQVYDTRGNPVYKEFGIPVYDPKPLAALLRSDKPISANSRYMLAEFIDPPKPPKTATTNIKLIPKPIVNARKEYKFFGEEIPAVLAYEAREKGAAGKGSIEMACETLGFKELSSFHKIRRKVLAYLASIRGT